MPILVGVLFGFMVGGFNVYRTLTLYSDLTKWWLVGDVLLGLLIGFLIWALLEGQFE